MMYKKISLFLFAVLAITLVFITPFYNKWLNTKFDGEVDRMTYQAGHLLPEERMEARFGQTYLVERAIIRLLTKLNAQDVVILLPPREFVKRNALDNESFDVQEPAVFYYFTGYKAITPNSPNVETANWALIVEKHKMALRYIRNKEYRDSLLTIYKPYM
jgi:hypothetical protein